jgi:hypothetical protein
MLALWQMKKITEFIFIPVLDAVRTSLNLQFLEIKLWTFVKQEEVGEG